MRMQNPLVRYETLLRGPETGNKRSSRLIDQKGTVQLSGKTIYNVNDQMWWLHIKGWTEQTNTSVAGRGATWLHLLVNGMTLGVDATATASTDKEAYARVSKSMVERGVWLP